MIISVGTHFFAFTWQHCKFPPFISCDTSHNFYDLISCPHDESL